MGISLYCDFYVRLSVSCVIGYHSYNYTRSEHLLNALLFNKFKDDWVFDEVLDTTREFCAYVRNEEGGKLTTRANSFRKYITKNDAIRNNREIPPLRFRR